MAQKKRINLALQGGGAHGAFTWGVLDRLLEDEDLEIAGISGTSAGAMNGAALKAGWAKGGRDGAREELNWFWSQMGAVEEHGFWPWFMAGIPVPGTREIGMAVEYSIAGQVADMLSLMSTPYALGPFYRNPLRPVVERFDFDAVCAGEGPELYISATKVRDGKIRVFEGPEVTADAILASACLPTVFTAIEFHDPRSDRMEAFWDGGYSGNPALFPLFKAHLPGDVLIVALNPLERDELPMLPNQIQNRINEISFNSSLLRELRAVDFVQRLLSEGKVSTAEKKEVLVHLIAEDSVMQDLSMVTKMFPNSYVLTSLKAAGRAAADRFLGENRDALNERSTVNLQEMFG